MKIEILRCTKCLEYGIETTCPICKSQCLSTKPAKYSVEDKYGHYRRIAKTQSNIN